MPIKKLKRPPATVPQPIAELPDDKPTFVPLHPAFVGEARVLTTKAVISRDITGAYATVNLSENTCDCPHGAKWQWHIKNQEWVPAIYCSHKLRAMADIVEKNNRDEQMSWAYVKALSSRYNMYEVVSAFHKELRRGDVERAVFWGNILMSFRGIRGVHNYLLNIVYEETRDHWYSSWLLELLATNTYSYDTMAYAITLFCKTKKKWELKHRMKYLSAEMRGYALLIKDFGRDVAKGGNIIPSNKDNRNKLFSELREGVKTRNLVQAQYGLKGLQKSVTTDIDQLRADICNMVDDIVKQHRKSLAANDDYKAYVSFLERRAAVPKLGLGYHETNTLIDIALGEPVAAGNMPVDVSSSVLSDKAPALRLGVVPIVPLYAHDNHTWAGKALLRRYPSEWQPGAVQEHFDLRLCGAYMGVVWRHLAFAQTGSITCEWSDVVWPDWLHETVSDLWY